MTEWFFSRNNGCPECGGMVKWSAKQCQFCKCRFNLSDRFEWADDWMRILLLIVSVLLGAWLGHGLFHMSKPLLAMAIAVILSIWYLCRMTPQGRTSPSI